MSGVEIYLNPAAQPVVPRAGFAEESRAPLQTHRTLPGYAPTPLLTCPRLARLLGVDTVLVKNESQRLGLPSFKILGASWAALRAVQAAWGEPVDGPLSIEEVRASIGSPVGRGLVAATDGNHGRGVARVASLLGLEAAILVPEGTAQSRVDAIAAEGATVEVVDGTYDDAISASARLADDEHLVVSDTSWEGYEQVPRAVVEGYSTMFFEVDDAMAERGRPMPDVVALQAGVGAFASAGLRHYRGGRGGSPPVPATVVVEPTSANCLMESARAGGLTLVPGPHPSSMAGLNCGMPSELVWPVVVAGTDVFVAVDDGHAERAMRALADEDVVAGESGAAGLAGLLALVEDGTDEQRRAAGLLPGACVLLVNTEGATDPANYERVVGRSADQVASGSQALRSTSAPAPPATTEEETEDVPHP